MAPSYRASARIDLQARARHGLDQNGRDRTAWCLEQRACGKIGGMYRHGYFTTLGEMKQYMTEHGIDWFARDGRRRFNEILKAYGIEPVCNEKWRQLPEAPRGQHQDERDREYYSARRYREQYARELSRVQRERRK